ncbi:hypothetical protein CFIO01_04782 [Colletotrichum fioriniae PJ7]|uniref:Uncharacterized protein n=1 Tax=Colletotrichum fioriniae PJ7 TaxID=1445577 RepID=A0A010S1V9_9PEZI|nr:hypothetical protein CFIO01_04782 [Colletotrichum fioriniae PJ7]
MRVILRHDATAAAAAAAAAGNVAAAAITSHPVTGTLAPTLDHVWLAAMPRPARAGPCDVRAELCAPSVMVGRDGMILCSADDICSLE